MILSTLWLCNVIIARFVSYWLYLYRDVGVSVGAVGYIFQVRTHKQGGEEWGSLM